MTLLPHAITEPITSALAGWFARRAPKSDSATLNLRNVYIFFSREGMLFALLLLITFVTGINYGNNLVLGLCFYLVSVWLISFHVTFAHISGMQVQLLEVTLAEAGQPVWVTLQVRSESRQPRRQLAFSFESIDKSSDSKRKSDKGRAEVSQQRQATVVLSRLQDQHTIQLPIMTNSRGRLELPRLQISTVYPLGIMRAWSDVYFARPAWVYPKPLVFDWQERYLVRSTDDLPTGGQLVQGQDDFDRLDNYIEGESLARVSWAHVARGQGMLTKHFADTVGHEQTLDYADMPAAHHEQKLAQLAYGAIALGKLNVPFQMHLPDNQNAEAVIGQGDSFAQACLCRVAKAS